MLNRILIYILVAFALLGLSLGVYNFFNTPEIVYIRSYDLVDKYEGTKEARQKFDAKKNTWQSNIDTLSYNLKNAIEKYNMERVRMSVAQRVDMEKYLDNKDKELASYTQSVEAKAREEEEQMMQAILNQVNSYVEKYGQDNGYDVILGTSTSGNVMFGNKELDVTEDVLAGLNKSYQGKE
ncbi:OmpH family outer membrane protein [Ohtaekwangia kribbensis]|uniref:OmpH family outer membrane protein n=1 Tax=Ohtaekwangia kribbensis TaxID=688913 RepID=A0ABW3K5A5_9BACT